MAQKSAAPAVHSTTLAFEFVAAEEFADIHYLPSRDEWLQKNHHHYEHVPYQVLFKRFWRYAASKWRGTHFPESKIKDAFKQYQMATDKVLTSEDDDCVAFQDGIYHLPTGAFDPDNTEGRSVTFHLPYNYSDIQNAEAPRWHAFLEQVLLESEDPNAPHDPTLAALLQECFGYTLFGSTAAETAFFFVGDGANGKGVVAHQLHAIIGERLTTAMSLETLTTRPFSVASLVGKRLNLSTEEESKFMKSDKFKALVSGETVTAERKFGDSFEFQPRAKFVFLSNQIPSFSGLNYGIIRRLKILPFYRKFLPQDRDTRLKYTLAKTELPGIIRWALEGATRLANNNFVFTQSEAAESALREFESDSSSAVRFFRETYSPDDTSAPGTFTCNALIYETYKTWCDLTGKKPLSNVNFFRDAKPAGFTKVAVRAFCTAHARWERGYHLKPKSDAPNESELDTDTVPSFL